MTEEFPDNVARQTIIHFVHHAPVTCAGGVRLRVWTVISG
jgi:hypothetical protein